MHHATKSSKRLRSKNQRGKTPSGDAPESLPKNFPSLRDTAAKLHQGGQEVACDEENQRFLPQGNHQRKLDGGLSRKGCHVLKKEYLKVGTHHCWGFIANFKAYYSGIVQNCGVSIPIFIPPKLASLVGK